MGTLEMVRKTLENVAASDNPVETFHELLKEAYRQGKRDGASQQREASRWETK